MNEKRNSASSASGVVLVTGAAGAIGRATVTRFTDRGWHVVGLDRVRGEEMGDLYHGFIVDLEDRSALDLALASARSVGPLRHTIGIAGGALPDEPATQHDPVLLDPDTFRASIEANLVTQFSVLQASLPWLRESGGDRSITLTSSFNALTGCGMAAYSAAKAGLIGMARALTAPLGAEGIRINVVAPGTIRTPRTERLWSHDVAHFERLEASTALGRLGEPGDVASTFFALATELTHVTGQVLVVDGGQMVVRDYGPGSPDTAEGGAGSR